MSPSMNNEDEFYDRVCQIKPGLFGWITVHYKQHNFYDYCKLARPITLNGVRITECEGYGSRESETTGFDAFLGNLYSQAGLSISPYDGDRIRW